MCLVISPTNRKALPKNVFYLVGRIFKTRSLLFVPNLSMAQNSWLVFRPLSVRVLSEFHLYLINYRINIFNDYVTTFLIREKKWVLWRWSSVAIIINYLWVIKLNIYETVYWNSLLFSTVYWSQISLRDRQLSTDAAIYFRRTPAFKPLAALGTGPPTFGYPWPCLHALALGCSYQTWTRAVPVSAGRLYMCSFPYNWFWHLFVGIVWN